MQVYSGKSVFCGIAIGKISVYRKNEQQVKRVRTEDTKGELARYEAAKAAAVEQLQELYQKALKEVGEANAAIFEIHQMMLDDGDYNESVENIIETQKVNAEYAVAVTGDNFAQMFRAMDDDYMRERAADVKDISERVLSILNGGQKGKVVTDEPVIIVADDLAPSETVQLEKDMVLSFVTVHGSVNSHTAILARTMAIPALIGTEELPLDDTVDGKLAVVDGLNGKIYVEPDAQTLEEMKKRNEEKAKILYDFLDSSKLFHGTVVPKDRSLMNVPFVIGDKDLEAKFVKEADAAGFVNLKGHRTVGGMRASIYNAMPIEGVEALVEFMKKFEKENA